jgi:hypothetical protein
MTATAFDLAGKTAVITGGASGIGLAIARRFAAHHAAVEIIDLQQANLDAAVAELRGAGYDAQGESCDVGDPASVDAAFARMGPGDVLVLSPGCASWDQFANYEARRDDLNTLANYAKQFDRTDEFLAQLTLLGGTETSEVTGRDDEEDRVCLSSIHQAKGLEWQVVFLAWLTERMFPGTRSMEDENALEEERRLFYVGVTRCKDELYLTYPELRLNAAYGEAFQRPSRFLEELPENLTERWEVARAMSRFTPQGDREKQRHQRREFDPADESQVPEWED